MAETIVLEATKREQIGKKVSHLRAQGIVPGVLYGPAFDAIPLQIEWTTLRPVLLEAGGSKVIQVNVGGEEYNALVRDVQREPLRGEVLHIDFYRVRMDVVIRTEVPVLLIGSEARITELGGVIIHELNSIMVECLPGDLPPHVEIDLAGLQDIGDSLLVSDLPELPGVTYMNAADDVVVTSSYMRAEAVEEEEEEEEIFEEGEEPELIRRRREDEEEDESEL
jgi:large subunit ribosomal protein L25